MQRIILKRVNGGQLLRWSQNAGERFLAVDLWTEISTPYLSSLENSFSNWKFYLLGMKKLVLFLLTISSLVCHNERNKLDEEKMNIEQYAVKKQWREIFCHSYMQ